MRNVLFSEPPPEVEDFLARRQALGQDGYDEVREGVYFVAPRTDPWHGYIQAQLMNLLAPHAQQSGLIGTGPFNLGEPDDFRVPDLGYHTSVPSELYVPTAAVVVEVMSPRDQTLEKFDFYARHQVSEIGTVDLTAREVQWWQIRGLVMPPDGPYRLTEHSTLLDLTVSDLAGEITWPVA